jgi:hypothetical protein
VTRVDVDGRYTRACPVADPEEASPDEQEIARHRERAHGPVGFDPPIAEQAGAGVECGQVTTRLLIYALEVPSHIHRAIQNRQRVHPTVHRRAPVRVDRS